MRKSNIVVLITTLMLIPLLATSAAADNITATRIISEQPVEVGDVINVEITLTALADIQAPALDENLPDGWVVTPVDNGMGTYKDTTSEWIWSVALAPDNTITIKYDVTIPADAVPGVYDIAGEVSAYEVGPFVTGGDNAVTVIGEATPVVTETPTPVVTETPTPVVTETPTPVVTETPTPVVTETSTPVVTETSTPVVTETPTPTEEPTEIPEFPIIAIPVMAILGMMFLLSRKK